MFSLFNRPTAPSDILTSKLYDQDTFYPAFLYEGSLNILSQNDSCEIMRRIESTQLAWQMARFIGVDRLLI